MRLTGRFSIFANHPFDELEPRTLFSIHLETLGPTETLICRERQISFSRFTNRVILDFQHCD